MYKTKTSLTLQDTVEHSNKKYWITAYFKEEEDAKRKIQAIADSWQAIQKMATYNRSQRMIATA
jgi:predicted DNA-binding protein (MmcQ/YjbR family)